MLSHLLCQQFGNRLLQGAVSTVAVVLSLTAVPELFFSLAGACKTDLLAGKRRCEVLELVSEERLSGEARSSGNLRK